MYLAFTSSVRHVNAQHLTRSLILIKIPSPVSLGHVINVVKFSVQFMHTNHNIDIMCYKLPTSHLLTMDMFHK